MSMDIFLVRHGEAAASWAESSDPGLSELGANQAVAATELLLPQLGAEVDLLSSPLARARETAQPLSVALDKSVSINVAFKEIPSPVPLPERQTWLRQFMQQQWQDQPPSLQQWRDAAMRELLALEQSAVIFTHFLVINAVVGQLQQRPETLVFMPDNASVTRLRRVEGGLELVTLGEQMKTVVN